MKGLPSLRQLRYLVAVADTGHFGRAAERCAVTQSTLSAGLKELEMSLGMPLIERDRRSATPTPIGGEIVVRARRLLAEAEDLVDLARGAAAPLSGPLQIGVIPTIAPYLLPDLVPALRARYPALQPFLVEDQTARLVERLSAGALDVAVLALPYDLPRLTTLALFDDPFLVAAPAGHALLQQATIAPSALKGETLLLLADGHCLREHALSACGLGRNTTGRAVEATSLSTLIHMVDSGLGVTLLPAMAARAGALRGTRIETRPLAGPDASRTVGLAWRASSAQEESYRLLGDVIRASNRA
ncbi:hydrogen peroxide-inducible genes activator [Reyranella sp. CPCC 100927]|uniref:hydrogen peroxide-inducible genes activator n=1 Tax=Reyranella sp. CPCC 100927 TaxID=2599616 RepID=UPI0011B3D275|nr:hydrogen peroxide-inducible genes activator [Reyranella sp. CPCC 100927]TWT03159.1 LysR family transcriptional regulator [Reyranella sp. CPCC 100927]